VLIKYFTSNCIFLVYLISVESTTTENLQQQPSEYRDNKEAELQPDNDGYDSDEDETYFYDSESDIWSNSDDEDNSIAEEIRTWALKFNISLLALSALLLILGKYFSFLPKCASILLSSNSKVITKTFTNGCFYYFGIRKAVSKFLAPSFPLHLDLAINIDGLPLYRSSSKSFWPILGSIENLTPPFAIGIFYGESKPNIHELLSDFCEEMLDITANGFEFENRSYVVKIVRFVCDAPARSLVKCTKGHSGYGSCDRCEAHGSWSGRVVFNELGARCRTDESFRNQEDKDFHNGISPLVAFDIDLINSFPFDYMHVVCLGVMKRMIAFWIKGPLRCRMSSTTVNHISVNMLHFQSYFPSDFSRRPRALTDYCYWKANEFRAFLLYSGIVALKGIVSQNVYAHFCLLQSSIYILLDKGSCVRLKSYAGSLLNIFISHSKDVYGPDFPVHNVHCLQHLSSDSIIHGPLHSHSAFSFESFLGKLKRSIRSGNMPLSQIVKRINEKSLLIDNRTNQNPATKLIHEHARGPLHHSINAIKQFSAVELGNYHLSISSKDFCFQDVSGNIHLILNILQCSTGTFFLTHRLKRLEDFYIYPFPSSKISVYLASDPQPPELLNIISVKKNVLLCLIINLM
jgi:hypothetical protein